MSWTDVRIEELRKLWNEGLSAQEIGRRLDVTKNAVIGKAHRLGLPSRPSPIRKSRTVQPKKIKRRAVVSGVGSRSIGPKCCWPFGDPRKDNFRFCEGPALPGKPYCQQHYDLAYVQPKPRMARQR